MNYLYRVKSIEAFETYYEIKSDPSAVTWSGYPTVPDKAKLLAHFNKLIADPDTFLFFYCDGDNNDVLGYAQLHKIDGGTAEYCGYSLLHKFHNKGLIRTLTRLILEFACENNFNRLVGWISEKNYASIRWFRAFGLESTGETKVVRLEALNRADTFHRYELVTGQNILKL